ncbi:MAG: NCS2 family permease [Desulfurococcales archaeon]|nr:NCS2 family permease [Desulfurococcales archaeon]
MPETNSILEKLKPSNIDNVEPKKEVVAGLTTFMTMAYILFVNPAILSATGMPREALVVATATGAGLATLIMALYAKMPFALAPGMGLNGYFAFTVVPFIAGILSREGVVGVEAWQVALAAVFVEGIVFVLLSVTKVRESVANSIPKNLKYSIGAGIGLFLTLIGFSDAGLVTAQVTKNGHLIALAMDANAFHSAPTLIALTFTLIAAVLMSLRVPGALLISIILAIVTGTIAGLTNPPNAIFAKPDFSLFMKMNLHGLADLGFFTATVIVFTFFVVDFFDTLGTATGLASLAGYIREDGKVERIGEVLLTDALGTTFGAMFGTSTVTTYIESASGIEEGGRTGLTSLIVALLFFASLFIAPLFTIAQSYATAPALIIVGLLMARAIKEIDLHDYTEAIPAFLTITSMPFLYSISDGIGIGFITYTVVKILTGKWRDLNPVIVGVALVFLGYFLSLPRIKP